MAFDPNRPFRPAQNRTTAPAPAFNPSRGFRRVDEEEEERRRVAAAHARGDGSMLVPRERSAGERFRSAAADAARRNPVISGLRALLPQENITYRDPQTGRDVSFPSLGGDVARQERERRQQYRMMTDADRWNASGNAAQQGLRGAATLGGTLIGSMADPLNALSPGKGIVGRAAGGAATNAGLDVLAQGGDIRAGIEDRYSPAQTLISAGAGAAFGGIEGALAREGLTGRGIVREGGFDPRRAFRRVEPSRPAQASRAARAAPEPIQRAISGAAQASGVSESYLTNLARRESSFNPLARAETSSATGLYQFTDGTWLNTVRRHADALGVSPAIRDNPAAVLRLRNDPNIAARAAALHTADNARSLQSVLGRAPTDAELYSAHFLGEGGARRLATADPRANAVEMFPQAAAANRSIFFQGRRPRTVAELRGKLSEGFGGGVSPQVRRADPRSLVDPIARGLPDAPEAAPRPPMATGPIQPANASRIVPGGIEPQPRRSLAPALSQPGQPSLRQQLAGSASPRPFNPSQPFRDLSGPSAPRPDMPTPDMGSRQMALRPQQPVQSDFTRPSQPSALALDPVQSPRISSGIAPARASMGFDAGRPFTPVSSRAGLNTQASAAAMGFDPSRPFKLAMGKQAGPDLSAYGQVARATGSVDSGLREAPRPTGVSRADGEAFSGQTVSSLARDLRVALGVPVRQGRVTAGRGAIGEYDTGSGVVRTKAAQELDVLSHELTHGLEFKANTPHLQAALRQYSDELSALAYPGADPSARRQEGFAEFGRWYVTNPDHARRVAPNFYNAFEAAVDADAPKIGQAMRAVQAGYQNVLRSASLDVAAGSIAYTGRQGPISDFARSVRERGIRPTLGDMANQVYRATIDDLHPLAVAESNLDQISFANTGQRLQPKTSESPYKLARLMRGAYAAGQNDILRGVTPYKGVDPAGPSLADALETASLGRDMGGWKPDDLRRFDSYLVARRMVHEWDRYAKGELQTPPDRNTRQFHEQVIADAEAMSPAWRDAAQQVYQWNEALWRKEFEAGFISREAYEQGLTMHPDYVPVQRDMSDRQPGGPPGTKRGANQFAGGVRQFRGSSRDIISPLSTMMQRAYRLNTLIRQNEIIKALDDMAQAAGPGGGAIAERLPPQQMQAFTVDAAEALRRAATEQGLDARDLSIDQAIRALERNGETTATMFRAVDTSPRKGEQIVFAWRDGKKQPVLIEDEDLFNTVAGLNREAQGLVVNVLSAATQTLRYGITLSPEFMARNLVRDQIATWINTDVGFTPFVSAARGGAAELAQGQLASRYATAGGIRGGVNTASLRKPIPRTDAEAQKQLRELSLKGYSVKRFASWRGLAEATDLSETSSRLGVFKLAFDAAKKRGETDYEAVLEAAYTARDYLDFDRRGSRMVEAARIVTFLNAALQGLDKTVRVQSAGLRQALVPRIRQARTPAEQRAMRHAMKAWGKVAVLGAFGGMLRALYSGDPEYEEIGDRLRATHWVFKHGGSWVFVPKPFELATLSNIIERAYEGTVLNDPTAGRRLMSDFGDTILPPTEVPGLAVPFQIGANRDGFGRPIVPDHLRGTVDPAQQFNSYTSHLSKMLGEKVGVSPAVIDHVITGFGGTLGRYVLQGTNLGYETATGAPRVESGPEDFFLSRGFVREVSRGATSQQEFWQQASKDGGSLVRAEGTFRRFMNEGQDQQAMAYLDGLSPQERSYALASVFSFEGSSKFHPMVRARESLSVVSEMRRELRNGEMRDLRGNPVNFTPAQRRQADDALSGLAMAEMRNALIDTQTPGWAQKQRIDATNYGRRLGQTSPAAADLLWRRLVLAGVPDEAQAQQAWQTLGPRLDAVSRNPNMLNLLMMDRRTRTREGKVRELGYLRQRQEAR